MRRLGSVGPAATLAPRVTATPRAARSTTIDATYIVEFFPAYYIFNSMLMGLLVLHCIWTYYILLMAYQALSAGQVSERSLRWGVETGVRGSLQSPPYRAGVTIVY